MIGFAKHSAGHLAFSPRRGKGRGRPIAAHKRRDEARRDARKRERERERERLGGRLSFLSFSLSFLPCASPVVCSRPRGGREMSTD